LPISSGTEVRPSERESERERARFFAKRAKKINWSDSQVYYKYLHGPAPSYLADELHHPAESEFRRRLRSASSHELSVPRTRLTTYGDRALPLAAVRIWNSLPQHVTPAPSLPVFCTRLKTYFFELCYS